MFHYQSKNIPTVEIALHSRTVEQLKRLAALLPTGSKPTRKAELVTFILKHLQGKSLRDLWQQLDSLGQAAVAEVVHSQADDFPTAKFVAKYGQEPNWGTGISYYYNFQPSLLGLFFYDGWMPQDLKRQLGQFVPEPAAVKLNSTLGSAAISHPRLAQVQPQKQRFRASNRRNCRYHCPNGTSSTARPASGTATSRSGKGERE